MKRRDLLAHLERNGCRLRREGGNHPVYWNPVTRKVAPIPRHTEIDENLCRRICKQLSVLPT
jgi:predicted RNA binding protein YcfA (HicA-like mRNA interferase family)